MMAVTAAMVKELRQMTNAGMMDCKKALTETNGDMEAAVEWLRKKGLSSAAKKAGRIASEGAISIEISDDHRKGTIAEINSETDFVAQNDNFKSLVKKATRHVHCSTATTVEDLLQTEIDGTKFEEFLKGEIAKIGENIVMRRFVTIDAGENGTVEGYIHGNGKVGVLVAAKCDSDATCEAIRPTLKNIAMHIAAMNPAYLDEEAVPAEVIEKEKEIAIEQLKKEGKPEKIWDKILPGKIKRFLKDNTLVNQPFVMDDKKTVGQVLDEAAKAAGGTAKIVEFIRFELGEGIEKKEEDFAAEVAAQMGK
ncbi:translation elongation factor Ts [Hydrogenimonas sp.]